MSTCEIIGVSFMALGVLLFIFVIVRKYYIENHTPKETNFYLEIKNDGKTIVRMSAEMLIDNEITFPYAVIGKLSFILKEWKYKK